MLLGKPHCAVGLVLALAVVMGDIDVDFAAPWEALLKGFDIPWAF